MLQKHYFDWDAKLARNDGIKVHKDKVVDLGPTIVLDQERCILCTRCIRVCDEVAGIHQLEMAARGDHELLTTAPGHQLDNPYSLNTVDVCPVGALTSKDFRFAMRVWELYTTPSICPGCATGCNVEVHHSRGNIDRLIPRENQAVNKHWMCDEGRLTYKRVNATRPPPPSRAASRSSGTRHSTTPASSCAPRSMPTRPRSAWCCNAQRPTRTSTRWPSSPSITSALGKAYLAGLDQGWSDDILVSADKNPNTAGAMAIGPAGCATLLDFGQRPQVGRGDDAAGGRHPRRPGRRRAGRAADRQAEDAGGGRHAPRAIARRRARRPAAHGLGRERRDVHQPTRHGPARARRDPRGRAMRCRAGTSSRTWRASWAPRWTSATPRRSSPRPSPNCRS